MSGVVEVSDDWLALREPEDSRARSRRLAEAAAGLAQHRVVVHDLGSGTGSMMRWLAPMVRGPQRWILHDWSAGQIERAASQTPPVDAESRPVSVDTRVGGLANLTAGDLDGASLVTASALLDVLTSAEVDAIVRAIIGCRVPALITLSVTGRVDIAPHDSADAVFETAFNAHQLRDAGGRRMLGRHAPMIARGLFLEAGWRVETVDTAWHLGDRERALLDGWWNGWVGAACEQVPTLSEDYAEYLARRRRQLDHGRLSAVVHHVDLMAWPS